MAGRRFACRASQELPLRRNPAKPPKLHPATGLPLSKSKGQHLLHNKSILTKMVEASGVRSVDSVYEVGCGTGELTMQLLRCARKVYTIDIEPRMVEETVKQAKAAGFTNLEAGVGDAVRVPMPRRFDLCVSNLPYQLSSPFLFQLFRRLSQGHPWRAAVLMLQQEFAERLLADPGEQPFSRLALSARLFAKTTRMFDVKPGSFIPQPQVHSTVVRLEPIIPTPAIDVAEFDAMVRVIFTRRRKCLRTHFKTLPFLVMMEQNYKIRCSLMGLVPSPMYFPDLLMSVLEEEGVMNERPFAMDVDDVYNLLEAFHRKGIYFIDIQKELPADGLPGRKQRPSVFHDDDCDDSLESPIGINEEDAPSPHATLWHGQCSPTARSAKRGLGPELPWLHQSKEEFGSRPRRRVLMKPPPAPPQDGMSAPAAPEASGRIWEPQMSWP